MDAVGNPVSEASVPVIVQLILAGLTLAVGVLGAMFGFLWKGIIRVQDETKRDIEAKVAENRTAISAVNASMEAKATEYRQSLSRVHDTIEARAGEHRQAQQQIWSEVRIFESASAEHRARIQERIGELPTRDDVKEARDELNQSLKDMEERLREMFNSRRNSAHP